MSCLNLHGIRHAMWAGFGYHIMICCDFDKEKLYGTNIASLCDSFFSRCLNTYWDLSKTVTERSINNIGKKCKIWYLYLTCKDTCSSQTNSPQLFWRKSGTSIIRTENGKQVSDWQHKTKCIPNFNRPNTKLNHVVIVTVIRIRSTALKIDGNIKGPSNHHLWRGNIGFWNMDQG